jgi:hypothetical protein
MRQRKETHSLELVWRGSQSYGSETDMFTSQYPTGALITPGLLLLLVMMRLLPARYQIKPLFNFLER